MTTFALIAEGLTDVAVIENIIYGLYKDNAQLNPLMPLRDATDTSRDAAGRFSNWELVMQYLSSDQIEEALDNNDYLIVQIDTDAGDHKNFGLNLTISGVTKSIYDIVMECRQLLLSKFPTNILPSMQNRIIFAIPVLSTECWLIGLYDQQHLHVISKANNCFNRLNGVLKGNAKIEKNFQCYSQLSTVFRKNKTLKTASSRIECLELFLNAMPP